MESSQMLVTSLIVLLFCSIFICGWLSVSWLMSKNPNRRNWRIFARSPIASNLDRFESEMSETIAKKKALEYELKNAQNEKTAVEQEYQLQLARQRNDFQMEKDRLLKDIDLQKKQAEFDFKLKEKELLAQKQLEIQKMKQETDASIERFKNENQAKMNLEINGLKTQLLTDQKKWMEENYSSLSGSMKKLFDEGNHTSKFVQELSLKMLDKTPEVHRLNIDTSPREKQVIDVRGDA